MDKNEVDRTQVIIAIDIGSSSIRCSAYNAKDLQVLASSSQHLKCIEPNSGKIVLSQQNSSTGEPCSLLDLIDECVDKVLEHLSDADKTYNVSALGFACFVMNLVGVDDEGNTVGTEATMTYACSSDAVAQHVHSLKSELGEEGAQLLYQRTGAPIHSAYAIAQLRDFYAQNSDCQGKVKKWLTLPSICLSRWTGNVNLPISFSEASWCGLLNYSSCEYEKAALNLLSDTCRKALPELADFDSVPSLQSGIPETSPFWTRWPKLRGTALFLGLGDGACANVGSKCSLATRIACTVGTSAAARVCLPCPVGSTECIHFESGLFCYRVDRSHVLVGGALTDGGSVVDWVKEFLNLGDGDSFEKCMQDVAALYEEETSSKSRHNTLTTIPFLGGERSTGFRTRATGAVLGLTRDTTPGRFVKSCLEGVTLRLNAVIDLMRKAAHAGEDGEKLRIIASGKALESNHVWRQMISDSTRLEVIFDHETPEATSRGVVLMLSRALEMQHNPESIKHLPHEDLHSTLVVEPSPTTFTYWDSARLRQEHLLEALSPIF